MCSVLPQNPEHQVLKLPIYPSLHPAWVKHTHHSSFLRGHPPYFPGQSLSLNLKVIGSARLTGGPQESCLRLQAQGLPAHAAAPGFSWECWGSERRSSGVCHTHFIHGAIRLSSHSLGLARIASTCNLIIWGTQIQFWSQWGLWAGYDAFL